MRSAHAGAVETHFLHFYFLDTKSHNMTSKSFPTSTQIDEKARLWGPIFHFSRTQKKHILEVRATSGIYLARGGLVPPPPSSRIKIPITANGGIWGHRFHKNQGIQESRNGGIKDSRNLGIKESKNQGIKTSRNQRIMNNDIELVI